MPDIRHDAIREHAQHEHALAALRDNPTLRRDEVHQRAETPDEWPAVLARTEHRLRREKW